MTTTETAIEAKLRERYGRARVGAGRRILLIVGLTLAAALVGWVAWTTVADAASSVDVDTMGYAIDPDTEAVTVTFQVTATPDTAFACAVEAQDEAHATVGWKVESYEATSEHARALSVTIPTVGDPVTGFVHSCWIP